MPAPISWIHADRTCRARAKKRGCDRLGTHARRFPWVSALSTSCCDRLELVASLSAGSMHATGAARGIEPAVGACFDIGTASLAAFVGCPGSMRIVVYLLKTKLGDHGQQAKLRLPGIFGLVTR
jgi:hypothetical protein